MNILFVTAEAAPFIKIGGLGDVSYALPQALQEAGDTVAVVLPLYQNIKERYKDSLQFCATFSVPLSWRQAYCGVFCTKVSDVTYYFIDNEYYFKRDTVYGHYDDGERFAFFDKAVLEMLQHISFVPDLIHLNDWQCALVPVFLNAFYRNIDMYRYMKTVFTIHNIEYQGKVDYSFLDEVLGLPSYYAEHLMFDGCLNFMFSAICLADKVTTVSKTYAEELKYPYYGKELCEVLRGISYKFCGITNGIDMDVFNPQTDQALFHKFSTKNMSGKTIGKKKLRQELGLYQEDDVPIVSLISRLVAHKGIDLIQYVRHEMMQRRLQLIVLGTGDEIYENMFRELSFEYPGRVSANICFNSNLASKIYAASDLFLMPSKSEPCGLSQMIAMRYGALPIVRETGGLKDTVPAINTETLTGRGFTFKSYNAHDMLNALDRSLQFFYEQRQNFKQIVRNNMESDFSFKQAAEEYRAVYADI